jgi:hypothetical protein
MTRRRLRGSPACNSQAVRHSIADHLRAELVVDALDMACWRQRPEPGQTVDYSDHGNNHPSGHHRSRLTRGRRRWARDDDRRSQSQCFRRPITTTASVETATAVPAGVPIPGFALLAHPGVVVTTVGGVRHLELQHHHRRPSKPSPAARPDTMPGGSRPRDRHRRCHLGRPACSPLGPPRARDRPSAPPGVITCRASCVRGRSRRSSALSVRVT